MLVLYFIKLFIFCGNGSVLKIGFSSIDFSEEKSKAGKKIFEQLQERL